MAFFVGAGTISEDVVRKETRNGVLAVFRLETGAPKSTSKPGVNSQAPWLTTPPRDAESSSADA